MTDLETLFTYRLKQAEETLADAEMLLSGQRSARSVMNRSYYAMFYAVLALFIRFDIEHKTSRHSRIISIFDLTFYRTGRLGVRYSKMLHELFDARQMADYQDFVEPTDEDARNAVDKAREFVAAIKELIAAP